MTDLPLSARWWLTRFGVCVDGLGIWYTVPWTGSTHLISHAAARPWYCVAAFSASCALTMAVGRMGCG